MASSSFRRSLGEGIEESLEWNFGWSFGWCFDEALNEALADSYKITWDEHISKYDGLKTKEKLNLLSKEKDLPEHLHNEIWTKKQNITHEKMSNLV